MVKEDFDDFDEEFDDIKEAAEAEEDAAQVEEVEEVPQEDEEDNFDDDPQIVEPEEAEIIEEAPAPKIQQKIKSLEDLRAHKLREARPAPIAPVTRPAPAQRVQQQVRQVPEQKIPAAAETDTIIDRFIPYKAPKRYGFIDATTNKPYMETEDAESAILAMLADIRNAIERIENSV